MTQAGGVPMQTSTIAIPLWFLGFLSITATVTAATLTVRSAP